MKALLTLFVLVSAHAQATMPTKPQLLKISCQSADGTTKSANVTKIFFSSEEGKAVGMNFGYNRGEEGLFHLEGNCEIRPASNISEK